MFECRWGVVCWGSAAEDLVRGTVGSEWLVWSNVVWCTSVWPRSRISPSTTRYTICCSWPNQNPTFTASPHGAPTRFVSNNVDRMDGLWGASPGCPAGLLFHYLTTHAAPTPQGVYNSRKRCSSCYRGFPNGRINSTWALDPMMRFLGWRFWSTGPAFMLIVSSVRIIPNKLLTDNASNPLTRRQGCVETNNSDTKLKDHRIWYHFEHALDSQDGGWGRHPESASSRITRFVCLSNVFTQNLMLMTAIMCSHEASLGDVKRAHYKWIDCRQYVDHTLAFRNPRFHDWTLWLILDQMPPPLHPPKYSRVSYTCAFSGTLIGVPECPLV